MVRMYLASLLCVIVLITACGQSSEEKAVEKQIEKSTGSDATVDLSDQGMNLHVRTKEGGDFAVSTGGDVEIPKDFPSDIFIYRPSRTTMAMKMPEGYSLSLTTPDDKAPVMKAYAEAMIEKGWSEVSSMTMGDNSMLVYEKSDRSTSITLAPSENELQISIAATSR